MFSACSQFWKEVGRLAGDQQAPDRYRAALQEWLKKVALICACEECKSALGSVIILYTLRL